MVVIEIIKGNLLDSARVEGEWYIAQQCNCNTKKPHGLSETISKQWPYADPYQTRIGGPDTPGTVVTMKPADRDDGPIVLCLMAQWGPSKPGSFSRYYPNTYKDTRDNRKEWFRECLEVLDDMIPSDEVVNMPFQIGCGLAGGKWPDYLEMLKSCKTHIRIWQL